jgi:hypothetical protein
MEKYYWNPTREDRVGVCMGIFHDDNVGARAPGAMRRRSGVGGWGRWASGGGGVGGRASVWERGGWVCRWGAGPGAPRRPEGARVSSPPLPREPQNPSTSQTADRADVEKLVDAFPGQSIDFFGALRARVYDDKVREFVSQLGVENLSKRLVNSREGKVEFEKPRMGMDTLMKYGRALVEEQDNVKRVQLAEAYMSGAELAGSSGSSMPEAFKAA